MSGIFVGIDLGGTNVKIGCFDKELKLIRKTAVATEADMGPEVVVEKIAQTTKELLADAAVTLEEVCAVGMGSPGPAKYREGVIESATNLPKFKNIPIRRMLSEKLGKTVVFENDANTACWGEYVVGAGKGIKDDRRP